MITDKAVAEADLITLCPGRELRFSPSADTLIGVCSPTCLSKNSRVSFSMCPSYRLVKKKCIELNVVSRLDTSGVNR
uniref:Uncharacterized protein n=1 Tax=Hippocampus comes TaxID=109280 RepID=A0A3Q2XT54_HIPCM